MIKKTKSIDSFHHKAVKDRHMDWPLAQFMKKYGKNTCVLFRRGRPAEIFVPKVLDFHIQKGEHLKNIRSLDGFLRQNKMIPLEYAARHRFEISGYIRREYGNLANFITDAFQGRLRELSLVRAWNVSIVAALIIGMFIMTSIYRYLGQSANAKLASSPVHTVMEFYRGNGQVLGAASRQEKGREKDDHVSKLKESYQKKKENARLNDKISDMVKGYPIEKLVPFIAQQDRLVAAYLISIAKKESDWGRRVPVLNGQDCFNYWGYRGIRARMGTGGHTCFDSPDDAVRTVAKRLKYLVDEEGMTTPQKMVVVWKCGYDCSWDSPVAVKKWVSDVEQYFDDLK